MGIATRIIEAFDKFDDIFYQPISTACSWLEEPLKKWEHDRERQKADDENRRKLDYEKEMLKLNAEVYIQRKTEINKKNIELEQWKEDQIVKRKLKIAKSLEDINQWRQDKSLERMIKITEAVQNYEKTLTQINVEAISAIDNMTMDFQERVFNLKKRMTNDIFMLQHEASKLLLKELKTADKNFGSNDRVMEIILHTFETKSANIISICDCFVKQLNVDIAEITQDFQVHSSDGRIFIRKHMERFSELSVSVEPIGAIEPATITIETSQNK